MHRINPGHDEATWIVLTVQGLWRAGMLISRIAVLVLTAICLREWSLLFLGECESELTRLLKIDLCLSHSACPALNVAGSHWLFMTIWVLLQNTDFCPTVWEERIYNCIIGFIYCFDFFNLRAGKSRYRVFVFYSVIAIENIAFLIVFVLCFKDAKIKAEELAAAACLIIGGMIIGLASMLFYYGKFHPSKIGGVANVSEGRSEVSVTNKAVTPRSFKQYYPNSFVASSSCSIDHSQRANTTSNEEITTDKQYLLTNIVQNSECTETGVVNQTCQIEKEPAIRLVSECEPAHNITLKDEMTSNNGLPKDNTFAENVACEYSVDIENDCKEKQSSEEDMHRQKRRAICLPTCHGLLDMEEKEVKSADCCLQKRRGICFSSQLILEMENEGSKVVATKEVKERRLVEDVNGGMAMVRERLGTPTMFDDESGEKLRKMEETGEKLTKELQQRDETMSCVTSIHDYENVCPLGVARPPWCIRSWKGYTDIETYIHDDSVVRDRRRDTLTSTTTGTTYSSEFSDTTLRGILKQDDYLDTLAYDLIDSRSESNKQAYNDDLLLAKDEQNPTLYIAKPVVIDDKGGMFALDTILEEHDEMTTDEKFEYTQPGGESVSTLVSTIDQISRYTAENSPRHVYHTTGSQWEDFDPRMTLIGRAQLTKALFESDAAAAAAAACNRSYINRLDEPESIVRGKREIDAIKDLVKYCTIESIRKTPLIDAILSDSPILGNKAKQLQKQATIACHTADQLHSKETDLYVEMSPLVPVENVSSTTVSSLSAQSPCGERSQPVIDEKNRRKPISYPRRRFSLLKEKFESKSQLVYVVTPNNNAIKIDQSAASSQVDKENLAPAACFKTGHQNNTDRSHSNRENDRSSSSSCGSDLNLKERRHIFLEQVLSPPKLLTWNKRKPLGGSTVKKPA